MPIPTLRKWLATVSIASLVAGDAMVMAQEKPATPPPAPAPPAAAAPAAEAPAPKIPNEQLDALVAPIALYPDPLLAQTLVASTYPLEIIQLYQWMNKEENKKLKDKALSDAVAKQPWDPSIQSMAAFPDVVKRLSDDIQWTTDLGNAFLAQQSDVMDSCQRMRKKAKDKGALTSNEQQKVETKTEGDKTVIVVQPTNPEVIYVPSYSPTVVYGAPIYPYPPIYYPPYPPGAAFVSFSIGVMWGAAIWGGSCCGCGWGGNNVNINVNNNFNKNNINTGNIGRGSGNNWQHNPSHRGAAPYGDKGTANKYGGGDRGGPSASNRGTGSGSRGGGPSAGTRPSGGGTGSGARPSTGSRPGGGSPSAGTMGGSSRGSNSIGSKNIPSGGSYGGSRGGGFSGGGGYSGGGARASSSRGGSSFRGGGGGGGRRR